MGYLTDSKTYDPGEDNDDLREVVENRTITTKRKEFYSDIVGEYIVDAKTGAKYPWRVGSLDERRFFRVTNTVVSINYSRKGIWDNSQGRSSRKAFYENPYAYMKHCNIRLDQDLIKAWYANTDALYPGNYPYPGPF
jgi:hypothetical protein